MFLLITVFLDAIFGRPPYFLIGRATTSKAQQIVGP